MQASDFVSRSKSVVHARTTDPDLALSGWPDAAIGSTDPAIHVVRSTADLSRVGRLRHALSREGRATSRESDFGSPALIEPVDRCSLVFVAEYRGEAVGTIRLTRAADAINDPHLGLLLEVAKPEDSGAAIVMSRFAVLPDPQAHALIVPMLLQAYRSACLAGAVQSFMAAPTRMVPTFAARGWQWIGRTFVDLEAGTMHVLRHERLDLDRLRDAGSPLVSVADDFFGRRNGGRR